MTQDDSTIDGSGEPELSALDAIAAELHPETSAQNELPILAYRAPSPAPRVMAY